MAFRAHGQELEGACVRLVGDGGVCLRGLRAGFGGDVSEGRGE